MRKTGNTPFTFAELTIEMDDNIFMPVQALNQLRRDALEALEETLNADYRRSTEGLREECAGDNFAEVRADSQTSISVSIENRQVAEEVLAKEFVTDIYYDSLCYDRKKLLTDLKQDVERAHKAGKKAYYILPAVFRSRTADFYGQNMKDLLELKLDGVVVKSYDALSFATKNLSGKLDIILDHSVYTWNQRAKELLGSGKPLRDTAPLELNRRELGARDNHNSEMLIYGYLPLMTSAQCVHANTGKCDAHKTVTYLKDRYGKYFPVKNNCSECYNTVYNTTPLMLFGYRDDLSSMGMSGYRLSFTIETRDEVRSILNICEETFLTGRRHIKDMYSGEYTNGHYKRGVE